MIYEKKLTPDIMASDFAKITPDVCRSLGIRGLICDIDNTLATYDDCDMPAPVEKWIEEMTGAGIGIAFVSNNTKDRVARFIGQRNIPAFPEAGKPRTRCFKAASEAIGCSDGGAAVLGDQLLTDSLAAHRAGLRAIIVPPIKDKTSAFFRLKRLIEAPYVRKYFRENGDCGISESVWHKKKRRS